MSKYLDPNKALQRLREDWKKHNRLIVAVDFDSTLYPYMADEYSYDFTPIRQLVRDLYELGCTIIIFTASEESRWEGIKQELNRIEVPYNLFNLSPEGIPNIGKAGKVYANAYLDDRAGLYEVFTHLSILVAEKMEEAKENYWMKLLKQQINS